MSQDILEISDRDTSFSAHESDEEKLYDAIKIVDERRGQYKIKWDGVDGKGNPWEDSWTNKRDCTDDIVAAWKLEKAKEKAQKKLKAEQKKAKKLSRARISTASKASTSRQTTSVAPSARSLRSRTAVPAEPRYDEYDSISRTPGNRKKRRLSSVPVQSPQDDSPSLRRAKKPRLAEPIERSPSPKEEEEEIVPDSDDDMPPVVRPNGKSKEADLSAPSRDVSDSDDEMAPVRRLNSKGKEVDRSVPAPKKPRGRPPKTVSLLQRQRDKFMDECDNFGDETPMNATPKSPVAAVPASGRFFTPAPLPLTQQSNILSPGGQARLDRFDDELAAPTQPQGSQKPPLFYPASSEERDSLPRSHSPSLPPRSPWNPRSSPARRLDSPTASEYAQPHSPPAPSRSPSHSPVPRAPSLPASDRTQSPSPAPQMAIQRHSPAPRAPSLPASDRTQSPSPAPQTVIQRHSPAPRAPSLPASDRTQSPSPAPQTAIQRHTSGRRTANDSYRIGDVPETQSSPESPPRAIASPKRSIISKMKPRSKTSTSTSMMFPPAKRVAPIPMMTAARFATQIREPDAGEEADVEEVDELMSSIEQFSSPEKKNKRPGRAPLDKGKGRQREVEDEDSEDEDSDDEKKAHLRMLKRGIEMAEAARAERQVEMAAYAPRRATFEEILQARGQEGTSMSTTESDILMAATGNGVGNLRHDIEALRQEEEENTQDVMTDYRTVVDPPDEHSDDDDVETSMPENLADLVNGQERNGDKAGDRSDAESSAGTVGDRSEGRERNRDAAGQRSDAEDSVDDVRNPSEDRETDVDGHLDIDGPERSAWNEEHASQLLQEASGDTSQDVLHDESMEDLVCRA
ncbi:hypothetical protein B0H17DRAFT_283899 [Mycena rosella]|uniref:Chromo domain-containing protein n=1 Tax=Mycena rosella TaxID=1033263 RepID=A0AAD7G4P7_MYCRO|nr:hypothetical protein B0H17DRAFT_283899 [Mycena rosella]